MARAFRLRFKGRETDVIEQIKVMGHSRFCKLEFGEENKGGYGLQKWFQKQPGCENDSIYRYVGPPESLWDSLSVDILRLRFEEYHTKTGNTLASLTAERDEWRRRYEYQKQLNKTAADYERQKMMPLIGLVESYIRGQPVET